MSLKLVISTNSVSAVLHCHSKNSGPLLYFHITLEQIFVNINTFWRICKDSPVFEYLYTANFDKTGYQLRLIP